LLQKSQDAGPDFGWGQAACIQIKVAMPAGVPQAFALFGEPLRAAITIGTATPGIGVINVQVNKDIWPDHTLPHVGHVRVFLSWLARLVSGRAQRFNKGAFAGGARSYDGYTQGVNRAI
jgi:hypothetical protein